MEIYKRKQKYFEKIKEFFEYYDYVNNLNDLKFEPNDSDIEEDNSFDNYGEED